MNSPTDRELFDAWAGGHRQSGAALLRRHFAALHRFFTNKVASTAEAEDLVQQTLTGCVEAHARFRSDASFRTFLFAIARNTWLKHLRDHKRFDALGSDASLADCGLGMSTAMDIKREQQLLLTALRHVSCESQLVLELYYWEQLSAKQIAAVLETTEPAVRARLTKAKLELRAALDSLARNPEELSSTVDGLERWAASLRERWSDGAEA